ncbi:MAG: hypothetical protein GKR94_04650 [Gammaproteobacteria bacterium]|nr:hypothetical protein [Gammaproteobacteria bacterium]
MKAWAWRIYPPGDTIVKLGSFHVIGVSLGGGYALQDLPHQRRRQLRSPQFVNRSEKHPVRDGCGERICSVLQRLPIWEL